MRYLSTIEALGMAFISLVFLGLILVVALIKFKKHFRSFVLFGNDSNFLLDYKSGGDFEGNLLDKKEEKDLMLYRLAHDLRGPLNSIKGLVELGLKDTDLANKELYFSKIDETVNGLRTFLEELFKAGKVQNKKLNLLMLPLSKIINDVLISVDNFPGRDEITIESDVKDDICVYTDRSLLHSVIQNLIENAIKYRDKQKTNSFLKISALGQNGFISLKFSDNGIGIPQSHLSRIFDLFYRVQTNVKGSGIGLHIVKESLKNINSGIKVYSEEGRGSLFILDIPSNRNTFLIREKDHKRNEKGSYN